MVRWVYATCMVILFSALSGKAFAQNISMVILCVFDSDVLSDCQTVLNNLSEEEKRLPDKFTFRTSTVRNNGDLHTIMTHLQNAMDQDRPQVLLTISGYSTMNTASMFAQYYHIPHISLVTDDNGPPLYAANYLGFGPSGKELAEVIFYLIRMQNTTEIAIIHEIQLENDGFVNNLRQLVNTSNTLKQFNTYGTSEGCNNDEVFYRKLVGLRDNGSRLIVLHVRPELLYSLVQCASRLDMFSAGHVWVSTNDAFQNHIPQSELPVGLLALQYHPSLGYTEESRNTLGQIASTVNKIMLEEKIRIFYPSGPGDGNSTTPQVTARILSDMKRNWKRPRVSYRLINLVQKHDQYIWRSVGLIRKNKVEIDTIVWPGGLAYGPITPTKKFIRVATVPAPPFVLFREPDNVVHECYTDTPCLQLRKIDWVIHYLDHFRLGGPPELEQYDFKCCSGLSVDLLNRLAKDLDFEFVLYFIPSSVDNVIGKLVNGTWDGVIGHVLYGIADIMIGAFSITASRSEWIDFTESFYQSGFTMLSVKQEQQPKIDAFLEPFSAHLWMMIILSAIFTAIVLSFLEWHSPYGLNPWGRKRDRNYTLGSALVMVFSVIFGHTVSSKVPKSWPSRLIQNVWSVFAIVMIAMYTANLAAFLAGKDNTTHFKGIFDPSLEGKRLAVIGETSVASYISQLNPPVFDRLIKKNVKSSAAMIALMKKGDFDIFIHDLPILEYARARLDGDCNLRIVSDTFGDDGYGIGLAKGSPWKSRMSELILSYSLSGFLEELQRAHFSELTCTTVGITQGDIQYGLMHTGGLFIMLAVAIALAFILLLLEHCFFKYYIPKLRKLPPTSRFKNTNAMFLSQRLYRTMMCDEVMSPAHGARQIVDVVRNRQFTQLFQKEQLQKKRIYTPENPGNLLWWTEKAVQHRIRESDLLETEGANTHNDESGKVVATADIHHSEEDMHMRRCVAASADENLLNDSKDPDTISAFSSMLSHRSSVKSSVSDWPSHWEGEWLEEITPTGSVSVDDEPLEMDHIVLGIDNPAFIMNNERTNKRSSQIQRHISLKAVDFNRHEDAQNSAGRLTKSYSWRPTKNIWTVSENFKHYQVNRNRHASCDENVYRNAPHMKDNRMKSRIRRDTLEGLCRRFSADLIDSFTVESLSKDELLVLWKASEINLRKLLAEMTRQRDRLRAVLQKGHEDLDNFDDDRCDTV